MTTKDYNAKAAEMMRYCKSDYYLYWDSVQGQPTPYFYDYDAFLNIPLGVKIYDMRQWNPLEDRNQAFQLLKRAEALGLAQRDILEEIAKRLGFLYESMQVIQVWAFLTCPTEIITMACVDVWQAWQEKGTKEDGMQ